jgi:hypothetical protein
LARLKRLRYLNIGENRSKPYPNAFGMQSLVELRASDTPLRTLPDSIRQLTALRESLEKHQAEDGARRSAACRGSLAAFGKNRLTLGR